MIELEQLESSIVKRLLPYIVLFGVAVIAIVLLAIKFLPIGPTSSSGVSGTIYVFDVVKFTNAQRKVASTLIRKEPGAEEASLILLNVSKLTRQTIEDITGPNATIIMKQAVIQGRYVDITDEVIKKLGLPTDVPTSSTDTLVFDTSPTNLILRGINKPISRPSEYTDTYDNIVNPSKELVP